MTEICKVELPRSDVTSQRRGVPEKLEPVPLPNRLQDQKLLAELDVLARLLDSRWRIPGTPFRFGVDAVIGLVPILGDSASALTSIYILSRARALGVGKGVLTQMFGNVVFDTLVGSIPLLGSVFDIYFKANNRNIKLLRRHLNSGASLRGHTKHTAP